MDWTIGPLDLWTIFGLNFGPFFKGSVGIFVGGGGLVVVYDTVFLREG